MKTTKKTLMLALAIMAPTLCMAQGKITFKGRVVSQMTYQVTVNGNSNGIVQLPKTAELNAATPFTIDLKRGARETGAVETAFVARHVTDGGNLKNIANDAQTAHAVQVQLLDQDNGKAMSMHRASAMAPTHPDNVAHTFAARYVVERGATTASPVTAMVEYVVSYL